MEPTASFTSPALAGLGRGADQGGAPGEGRAPMKVTVTIMLKDGVLDPQGKAIGQALTSLGFAGVGEVRAGKVIEIEVAETDPKRARASAEAMARKLLANTVIESFRVDTGGA